MPNLIFIFSPFSIQKILSYQQQNIQGDDILLSDYFKNLIVKDISQNCAERIRKLKEIL